MKQSNQSDNWLFNAELYQPQDSIDALVYTPPNVSKIETAIGTMIFLIILFWGLLVMVGGIIYFTYSTICQFLT